MKVQFIFYWKEYSDLAKTIINAKGREGTVHPHAVKISHRYTYQKLKESSLVAFFLYPHKRLSSKKDLFYEKFHVIDRISVQSSSYQPFIVFRNCVGRESGGRSCDMFGLYTTLRTPVLITNRSIYKSFKDAV